MDGLTVEIAVADGLVLPVTATELESAALYVLRAEGVEAASVSLSLVGDEQIGRLNQEYLGHPGPTDVISFALHPPGHPPVGDVYIGAEQALRQAAELHVDLAEELLRLVVHGTLHVLGYDHPQQDREASEMVRRQEALLAAIVSHAGGRSDE